MLNCCRAPALAFKNASVFHLHPVLLALPPLRVPALIFPHDSSSRISVLSNYPFCQNSVQLAPYLIFAARYCSYQKPDSPICRLLSRANSHRSWATQLASSSKAYQKIFSSDFNTRPETAVIFYHSPSEVTIRLADVGKFFQPETDFERRSPSPVHTIAHLPAHCVSLVLLQHFSGL